MNCPFIMRLSSSLCNGIYTQKRYFGALANITRRDVLLVMLKSTVVICVQQDYIKGGLMQVQSSGLYLKSSVFDSCNTFL